MRSQNHSYNVHGEDASGYAGYTLRCTPLTLTDTGALTVTLLDHEGTPVPSVAIAATSSDTGVATVTATDTTDASGECTYTVTNIGAGSAVITFSHAGAGRPVVGKIPVTMS
jgi:hypothetical protein